MGLIKSVNDITYELQGQKTDKEQKRQQQTRKRLLKTELYNYFDFRFRRDGNAEATYFEMLNNKMLIIDQLKKEYSTKYDVKLNFENISYLKQNYFKILNSVKRQYFELEKIKQKEEKEKRKQQQEAEKQKEKQQQEAEQQKAYKWKIIFKTIKITFYILLTPFWLCLLLVWIALGVNHKKYKRR